MKISSLISYVTLVMAVSFVLYSMYIQFFPFETLTVKSATAKTTELHLGEVFYYTVDYCKYTKAPAVVYRTFHKTDETFIETFPVVQTITVPGCNKTQIPLKTYEDPKAPTGEYYMLVDAVFTLYGTRQIHVIFKTNTFTIK